MTLWHIETIDSQEPSEAFHLLSSRAGNSCPTKGLHHLLLPTKKGNMDLTVEVSLPMSLEMGQTIKLDFLLFLNLPSWSFGPSVLTYRLNFQNLNSARFPFLKFHNQQAPKSTNQPKQPTDEKQNQPSTNILTQPNFMLKPTKTTFTLIPSYHPFAQKKQSTHHKSIDSRSRPFSTSGPSTLRSRLHQRSAMVTSCLLRSVAPMLAPWEKSTGKNGNSTDAF